MNPPIWREIYYDRLAYHNKFFVQTFGFTSKEYFIYKALYDNKLTTVENKIMEKLKYIFDITYGTKLDKNKTIEQNDKPCLCRYHNTERRS